MLREHHLADRETANPLRVLERAQEIIEEQRAELARWLADLQAVHAGLQHEGLQGEGPGDVQGLLTENEELRRRLVALEIAPAPAPAPAVSSKEADELRAEIKLLRQLLHEKDAVVDELRAKKAEPKAESKGEVELDSFEAELHVYRKQLEVDREKLNAEIQQMRLRNEELDEATREMEMELSRERAELARERQRLERLRDETKTDLERIQRDGGMRESLAPVQRLREEMTQRKPPEEAALNDRLRSFRNRLSE